MKMKNIIKVSGRFRIIKSIEGKVIWISDWQNNLVMNGTDTGVNLIADKLAGTNTYSLNITHGDIGTGSTAPAISDIALQTPTNRSAVITKNVSAGTVTFTFFFSNAILANGIYNEFGIFVDGTSTISTGQLFARSLFLSAYTKATGEDTTIQYEIDIS